MKTLSIDIETYSDQNLAKTGVYRYVESPVFEILLFAYSVDGGSVRVSVSSGEDAGSADGLDSGKTVTVTVADSGIGIAKENQDRIFERFYRVDKSHSKASGGTGLGLSIVKHGVLYHGGTVRADSTQGEGTTFTVELPITPQNVNA